MDNNPVVDAIYRMASGERAGWGTPPKTRAVMLTMEMPDRSCHGHQPQVVIDQVVDVHFLG